MAKRVLVLTIGILLILSLSVSGAKKSADEKMIQMLERADRSQSPDGSEGAVIFTGQEPKIFLPAAGDTAGFTWYPMQQASTMARHIAYDPGLGLIHVAWTNLIEEGGNRYMDYNAWDPVGGWLVAGGMHTTPAVQRAGFGGVDVLPDGREVVHMHRGQPDPGNWASQIAIESSTPGLGEFEHYDLPDSFATRPEPGMWPYIAASKQMRGDTAFIHITFSEGETSGSIAKRLGYVRCFEDPTRADTLVCQSPNGLLLPIKVNTQLKPNKIPYTFDNALMGEAPLATSPVSEKVALCYYKNYVASQSQSEVYYIESQNNGDDWLSAGMTPIKLTSYEGTDTRAYDDVAIAYDYQNELHILWTTFPSTNSNDVSLWHWNTSQGARKIAHVTAPDEVDPSARNLLIAKFTMGVWPDSNYLFTTYSRYFEGDIAGDELTNSELCVKGSTNGGLTWGPEVNMTNTHTPGCAAGDCLSEHWSSIAEIVDDSLHIFYAEDTDPGDPFYSEGVNTNCAMRYFRYPRPSIPAVALIAYTPAHLNRPFLWATNGGSTSDTIDFDNTGTNTLYVTLSGPSWLTINPSTFSIAEAGATQKVYLTFNGASFNDTLIIDSMMVVSNNGTSGMVYSDTAWAGIHFVVADEFYRVEYDTCDYSPITQVSNMGNIGSGDFDSVGMFYNGKNYLFEFTPVFVTTDINGSGPVGFTWIHQGHYDFLPEGNISSTKYDKLAVQVFYQKAGLVFPPRRSDHNLYHSWWGYWTRYSKVIQLHPQIVLVYDWWVWNAPPVWWDNLAGSTDPQGGYFGIGADWDVTADASGRNKGGYDDVNHLIWQYADTSGFESYYGGFQWLRHGVDGVMDSTGGPFGAHVTNNQTQMYPDQGFQDDSLYMFMSTPGYSIEQDSAQDMNIIMSFLEVANPTPTTVVELRYALVVSDQGEAGLKSVANLIKKAKPGDANRDGDVSVSDVVYLINALFKGGPAPWKAYSDANGDGDITVSDVVYLINALFKGGPKPKLVWCQTLPPW